MGMVVDGSPSNGALVTPTWFWGLSCTIQNSDWVSGTVSVGASWVIRDAATHQVVWSGSNTTSINYGPDPTFVNQVYASITIGGMAIPYGNYEWYVTNDWKGSGSGGPYLFTLAPENRAPTASLVAPSGTIPTLTPTIVVNFSDPDTFGNFGTFAAYQIQVRPKAGGANVWDTDWVPTTGGEQSARSVSRVYAGSALSNMVEYEARARVQDGAGAPSDYTAWKAFTPQVMPGAPTGILPSGLITTLTPTFKGAYVQASGGTESRFQYRVWQSTVLIYDSGDVNSPIATGQVYGGAPALSWGTQYAVDMRSKDNLGVYGPWSAKVPFKTKSAPLTPSGLTPSGGAISPERYPTLGWAHNDPDGAAQTAAKVEVYDLTAGAYVSGYDPKTLAQSTGTHDMVTQLDLPSSVQWRVATQGDAGPGYGPFSAWQQFAVADVPLLTVTSPTVDEVLTGGVLTVTWTFSGGSGTQQDYRVRLYGDDGALRWDSGLEAGEDGELSIPSGVLHNLQAYDVQVSVRDTLSQEAVSPLIRVTTAWTPPDPVSGLMAAPVGGVA